MLASEGRTSNFGQNCEGKHISSLGYVGMLLQSSGTGFCITVSMIEVGRFISRRLNTNVAQGKNMHEIKLYLLLSGWGMSANLIHIPLARK